MSDVSWGSDHLEPPKKTGIPGWVLGCLGGCMFVIGAAVVATYFVGKGVQRWIETKADPDVQWPKLAAVLPYDAPPEGFDIVSWPIPFLDLWQLESVDEDLVAFVAATKQDGSMSEALGQWFAEPKQAPMLAMQGGTLEATAGTLTLQGRELNCMRVHRVLDPADALPEPPSPPEPPTAAELPTPPGEPGHDVPQPPAPGSPDWPGAPEDLEERELTRTAALLRTDTLLGDGLAIDVSPEDGGRRVVIWLVRRTAGATISDQDAARLLAPFHIGPVR